MARDCDERCELGMLHPLRQLGIAVRRHNEAEQMPETVLIDAAYERPHSARILESVGNRQREIELLSSGIKRQAKPLDASTKGSPPRAP